MVATNLIIADELSHLCGVLSQWLRIKWATGCGRESQQY